MEKRMVIAIVIACLAGFALGWVSKPLTHPSPSPTQACPLPTAYTKTVTSVYTKTVTTTLSARATTTVTKIVTATVSATPLRPLCIEKPPIRLIVGHQYPEIVTKLIERANESVYVMMFAMKYYPMERNDVDKAIEALCTAAKRGVSVRVLVDYVTAEEYRSTITYLERCGVEVKVWRECGSLWKLHAKVVIVDGKYVVVGSHNWTYSAFNHNIEVSIEVESPSVAAKLVKLFNELWSSSCAYAP